MDFISVVGGVYHEGLGFIPTGFSMGSVYDGSENCLVKRGEGSDPHGLSDGQVYLKMAMNHAGTEGSGYMLIEAARFDRPVPVDLYIILAPAGAMPFYFYEKNEDVSVRLLRAGRITPATPSAGPFLPLAESAGYDRDSREISWSYGKSAGNAVHRLGIEGKNGAWRIYTVKSGNVILPAPPEGLKDRVASASRITMNALLLKEGVTIERLFSSSGGERTGDLFDLTDAYTQQNINR
jgi:hypothetical protein